MSIDHWACADEQDDMAKDYEAKIASLQEYIDLLENQVIAMMTADEEPATAGLVFWLDHNRDMGDPEYRAAFTAESARIAAMTADEPSKMTDDAFFSDPRVDELARVLTRTQQAYDDLRRSLDEPVPFLPADPEEQRRRGTTAADGSRAMIYRGRS